MQPLPARPRFIVERPRIVLQDLESCPAVPVDSLSFERPRYKRQRCENESHKTTFAFQLAEIEQAVHRLEQVKAVEKSDRLQFKQLSEQLRILRQQTVQEDYKELNTGISDLLRRLALAFQRKVKQSPPQARRLSP